VVIMSNPRGSSGREESWGQAILGLHHHTKPGSGWGGLDVDDVLAVLDHALATYTFCDADRVGMLGGSYGGFMATWLAARHGHRFGHRAPHPSGRPERAVGPPERQRHPREPRRTARG
jgi:dipeptidyl aminopeptidase/acylaminoacyl peptidase